MNGERIDKASFVLTGKGAHSCCVTLGPCVARCELRKQQAHIQIPLLQAATKPLGAGFLK